MDNQEKRKALAKWILKTDENVLNEIEAVYKVHSKSEEISSKIVAYTVNGKALTKEMYVQKIKEAENGEFISSKDLKNKILSW